MGNCLSNRKSPQELLRIRNQPSRITTVMNNYSKFLGKKNAHLNEPRIGNYTGVRLSSFKVEELFIIENRSLGAGQFGTVRLAKLKTNQAKFFALKTIKKGIQSTDALNNVLHEVIFLAECDHPNIARFYETFDSKDETHFLMEYCSGGDLAERIHKTAGLTEDRAREIFRQVLLAVNHLHIRGICHRDVKPENFIFSHKGHEAQIKLVDFGFAKKFFGTNGKSRMYSLVGTPAYVAPEVLTGDYDEKCDIWSAGILFFNLLTGHVPYQTNVKDSKALYAQIMKGEVVLDYLKKLKVSKACKDLMSKLLTHNAQQRISLSQALCHEWFQTRRKISLTHAEIKEYFHNFRRWKFYNQFQRNVFKMYVKNLTESQLKDLTHLFRLIDRDLDGIISFPELKYFLVQHNLFTTNKDCLEAISQLHQTDNHHVFYSEFLAAAIDKAHLLSDSQLKKLFQNLKLTPGPILEFSVIANFYMLQGYHFNKNQFMDLLTMCKVQLRSQQGLHYQEFKMLMSKDLEFLTNDEDELNNMQQRSLISKRALIRGESLIPTSDKKSAVSID